MTTNLAKSDRIGRRWTCVMCGGVGATQRLAADAYLHTDCLATAKGQRIAESYR